MAAEESECSREKAGNSCRTTGLHVVAKPNGPACNLNRDYCFYLEKQALFPSGKKFRMTDNVLGAFIKNYITSQPTPDVEFVWQGGEPILLGPEFFRRVVELQKPYARHKTIRNAIQTNGTLLDDAWCRFLKKKQFHGRYQPGWSREDPRPLSQGSERTRDFRTGDAGPQASSET